MTLACACGGGGEFLLVALLLWVLRMSLRHKIGILLIAVLLLGGAHPNHTERHEECQIHKVPIRR